MQELNCKNNKIKKLDKIPKSLKELDCSSNKKELNHLQEGLEILNCAYNQIIKLDKLPKGLVSLDCSNNQIIILENLPKKLKYLDCENNQIEKFNIPNSLSILICKNNKIKELDNIPKKLAIIDCSYNLLPSVDRNILKEIDINRRRDKLVMFIVGTKSKFSFDILSEIGKYVLT